MAEEGLGEELEDGGRDLGAFEVEARGVQSVRGGVVVAGEGVGGEDVGAEGVGVAEVVGQADGFEGVGVGEI